MKKKIILICVVILVLCALIALLPYPQKIERTFYGVNSFNGEKADISFEMIYLRYLFRRDRMRGEVSVTCGDETIIYTDNALQYIGYWPLDNEDETFHYFSGFYYNLDIVSYNDRGEKETGDFESVYGYLSNDFNKIMIYHQPDNNAEDADAKQYVGNVEKNKEQETIKYFGRYAK